MPGSSSYRAVTASRIRSRSWLVAARVKVTIRSLSRSTGCTGSRISRRIRSTSTAVLPEPAAAETSRLLPLVSMTFFCSSVQLLPIRSSFSPAPGHLFFPASSRSASVVSPSLFPSGFRMSLSPPPSSSRCRPAGCPASADTSSAGHVL